MCPAPRCRSTLLSLHHLRIENGLSDRTLLVSSVLRARRSPPAPVLPPFRYDHGCIPDCCRKHRSKTNQRDALIGLFVLVLAWLRAPARPACRVAVYVKQLRRLLQEQPVFVQHNFFCGSAHYELVDNGPQRVCHWVPSCTKD